MSSVHNAPPKILNTKYTKDSKVLSKAQREYLLRISSCTLCPLCLDKINRPSRLRRAIGFDLSYSSTSKASPNDTGIVIIIIIGEDDSVLHSGGIIAQRF
jgi:hypothetical protein